MFLVIKGDQIGIIRLSTQTKKNERKDWISSFKNNGLLILGAFTVTPCITTNRNYY